MAGLDQVKGPHWSQILALYGAKGQVSEILKDRNQVQLKDKARNLKLFFLKSNIEVPYYLQCVTGELKTRAPTQAARKEAEERARLASDEEQARFNGIMALAGGMQDQSHQDMHGQHDMGQQQMQMDGIPHNDSMDQHQHQHQQREDSHYREELHVEQHNAMNQHSHQPAPHGTQTPQQAAEVSQLEFEDALGARLMESLEDHDKRAASVAS